MDYLKDNKFQYAGFVVSDFPGQGLINALIDVSMQKSLSVVDNIKKLASKVINKSLK